MHATKPEYIRVHTYNTCMQDVYPQTNTYTFIRMFFVYIISMCVSVGYRAHAQKTYKNMCVHILIYTGMKMFSQYNFPYVCPSLSFRPRSYELNKREDKLSPHYRIRIQGTFWRYEWVITLCQLPVTLLYYSNMYIYLINLPSVTACIHFCNYFLCGANFLLWRELFIWKLNFYMTKLYYMNTVR